MKKTALLIFLLLLPAVFSAAAEKKKVLVYYFQNISNDGQYADLSYQIPLFIYKGMKEARSSSRLYLIAREGMELQAFGKTADLWNKAGLIHMAQKKKIDEVIYGFYYVQDGRPVVIGRVFYVKSGLELDIKEKESEYYRLISEAELRGVQGLHGSGEVKKSAIYNPSFARIFGSSVKTRKTAVLASAGPLFPVGVWSKLYSTGVFSEISVVHFPKMNVLPLGVGLNSNYVILSRGEDESYTDSRISVLSAGATIQYKIGVGRALKEIVLDFDSGLSMSLLNVSGETFYSFDPYMKSGLNFIVQPFERFMLSVKTGYFTINYRTNPIDAIFLEFGLWGEKER